MNLNSDTNVAQSLLETSSVKLNVNNPFTWTSGLKSPIYCDNRRLLSFPKVRTLIKNAFVDAINQNFEKPDSIVGVATAGIAHAVLISDAMNLPNAYIRPEPKKHGMKNQIEGHIEPGSKILVIEDLISTGISSGKAIIALREQGFEVMGLLSIFTYELDISKQYFEEIKVKTHSLTTYSKLITLANQQGMVNTPAEIEAFKRWRKNPKDWM